MHLFLLHRQLFFLQLQLHDRARGRRGRPRAARAPLAAQAVALAMRITRQVRPAPRRQPALGNLPGSRSLGVSLIALLRLKPSSRMQELVQLMHLQDTSEVDGLRELNLSNKVRRSPCPLLAPRSPSTARLE